MKDRPKIGDILSYEDTIGVLVADIDNDVYDVNYPKEDWNYLKTGILIYSHEIGLVHYPVVDDNQLIKCN